MTDIQLFHQLTIVIISVFANAHLFLLRLVILKFPNRSLIKIIFLVLIDYKRLHPLSIHVVFSRSKLIPHKIESCPLLFLILQLLLVHRSSLCAHRLSLCNYKCTHVVALFRGSSGVSSAVIIRVSSARDLRETKARVLKDLLGHMFVFVPATLSLKLE